MKTLVDRLLRLAAAVTLGSCAGSGHCDTLLAANAPFVACEELPSSTGTSACAATPVSKLYSSSAGLGDAGSGGTCSVTMPCGTHCEIRDPNHLGTFLPYVCVRATEGASATFALDPLGASAVCALPCGDPSFPCPAPATCISATNAETGGSVSICQFPQP